MTLEQALQSAVEHHRAGQLAEAERIYRQILSQQPANPDALHLLGMIANQMGHPQDACELIGKSVAIYPAAESCFNLAVALEIVGEYDRAIAALRQAVALKPAWAEAHGNLALLLQLREQLPEALEYFKQATELEPADATLHFNFGNALIGAKRSDEAAKEFSAALRLNPSHAEAHNNLGHVWLSFDRYDLAIAEFNQAIALRPEYPDALSNLGHALNSQSRYEESILPLQRAVACGPDFSPGHNNLGNALCGLGRLEEAAAAYRNALALQPGWAEAQSNLSAVLRLAGGIDEAIAVAEQALQPRPDCSLTPERLAKALNNLANAHRSAAQMAKAIETYARAADADPSSCIAASNRLFALQFDVTDPDVLLAEHRKWDQQYAAPLKGEILPLENDRTPDRRLRIGYVSPDFRNHCQAIFTSALFPHHDHEQFEFFFYADVPKPDAVTRRLQTHADVWRSTTGMNDAAVADLIRADGIDVLVDLTMHMANCRPLVFARKPAPVQAAWLAYPGTTGLSTMDYRLTDPYLDSPGYESRYTEESIHLPDTFWCYDPYGMALNLSQALPTPNELPAITNGFITFGCFNDFSKLNIQTLQRWARLMQSVPNSRLHLLAPRGSCRDHVLQQLNACGIETSRIEFIDRQPRAVYLSEYHRIDFCVDTLPANGHTTSLDAFWMGVPVLTRIGPTVTGRAGLSQLTNLQLPDFAAESDEQFIQLGRRWASDLPDLAEIRRTLRDRMSASPLMDGQRFARNMEAAFRQMWKQTIK